MIFVDTHTHNADEAYRGCEDEVIARAVAAGVTRLLQADIDSKERPAMFELCSRHPGVLFPMLGLYPGSVDENWQEEIDLVSGLASLPEIIAIGEIGLDYHYSADTASLQKDALKAQFEIAAKMNLPVNIHLREATDDFFKVLDSCRGLGLRGNLHAFSGSAETFRRIDRYGDWYVGIGGVLTFKKAGIARDVLDIPLERIVLETDAPYLAPTPLRGTRNESSNIPVIAEALARIKGVDVEEIARTTTENAENLFERIAK